MLTIVSMSTMSPSVTTDVLDEAALLVAGQPGAAQRIRSRHRRRMDTSCSGCGDHVRTGWPCVLIAIAHLSDTIHRERGDMADPKKPEEPGKHEDDRDGRGVPQPDKWKDPNKK